MRPETTTRRLSATAVAGARCLCVVVEGCTLRSAPPNRPARHPARPPPDPQFGGGPGGGPEGVRRGSGGGLEGVWGGLGGYPP